MSRFDARTEFELSVHWSDLAVFALFPVTAAAAMVLMVLGDLSAANKAACVALFPLWVALVVQAVNTLTDSAWCRLIAHPGGHWQLHSRSGSKIPVTLFSNFRCRWVVLLTVTYTDGCHRQLLWRHHQPDSYRYLLAYLARQTSRAQEA